MKKTIIIFISIFALYSFANAQQGMTLFNMNRVLQSQWVNPATQLEHKIEIGGLLAVPLGLLPPPMYFNYANNSFHYNHLFHMGTGLKADSLVLDLDQFQSKLRNTTHMRFDFQLELINVGIRLENYYLSFALTEKIKWGMSLPYDLFEFALNGNRPYMLEGKPHDFSNLNVNFTHYREFAVGLSTRSTDKLNFGGRAKILFGQSNFSTEINKLTLNTDPNNYNMTFDADMAIRGSFPVEFLEYDKDSMKLSVDEDAFDNFQPQDYLLNFSNIGMAFDFGASYKINDDIEVFASVTDFGLISWNSNPVSFNSKGEFLFRGIQVDLWETEEEQEEAMQDFADSVLNIFNFEQVNSSYVSFLPSSVYLGGVYKLHEKIHFGALYRSEFYRGTMMPSFSLSANSNLTKWFSAHASYSIMHNSAANLGLGLTLKLGFINWYFVTDNITGMIFPQKMKNLNFRFGCNWVFGKELESTASYR